MSTRYKFAKTKHVVYDRNLNLHSCLAVWTDFMLTLHELSNNELDRYKMTTLKVVYW